MSIIDSIQLSGSSYDVRDKSATTVVSLTQQEYDALPSSAKTANILYNITDATAGDLTQYWTSAQTQSAITEAVSGKQDTLVSGTNIKTINNESILGSGNITIQGGGTDTGTVQTMIDQSISGKADSSTVTALTNTVTGHTADTSIHVTTAQTAAWDAKSDFSGSYNDLTNKLSAGTNITIVDNVISAEGGGGKAVTGGTNISVTTGETADTINCTLNISNGTGTKSIKIGDGVTASGILSFAQGDDANASGNWSTAFGRGKSSQNYTFSANSGKANRSFSSAFGASIANNTYGFATGAGSNANGHSSFVSGWYTNSNNNYEAAFGNYNNSVSASTTFGESGNTLFSVGNGTADNARHNAFEIRQNGDIYLSSGGTDIKLQDHLGGGGGTVESAITSGSTNAVESSAIWSATTYNKEVTLQWDNGFPTKFSTNYPSGCKKFVVTVPSNNTATIMLYNGGSSISGNITISNFSSLSVSIDGYDGTTYTIDGNDVKFVVPDTITFDQLQTDTRWITSIKAIVEGAWIADNTYMKSEVDTIQNTLQNNINQKLDSTAYTPVNVDSALNVASTNPVQNQALYSELRITNGGETETTLTFGEYYYSTNYPQGCTQIKVEVVGSNNGSNIGFFNDLGNLGSIMINNWGSLSVDTSNFQGATYEISGTTVIISYPTVTNVTRIQVNAYSSDYVYKAVTTEAPTALKDQVVANTTALGGLKLVKLTESAYQALSVKDPDTLYVVIPDPS